MGQQFLVREGGGGANQQFMAGGGPTPPSMYRSTDTNENTSFRRTTYVGGHDFCDFVVRKLHTHPVTTLFLHQFYIFLCVKGLQYLLPLLATRVLVHSFSVLTL